MFATIEDAARFSPALRHLAAALGTGNADCYQQRFGIMALGETRAGLELTEPAFADDHVLAAQFTLFTA